MLVGVPAGGRAGRDFAQGALQGWRCGRSFERSAGRGEGGAQEGGTVQESHPEVPRRLVKVAMLLADGAENGEIAAALCITQHSAENYVSELKDRLHARSRVDLALKCLEMRSMLHSNQRP